MPLLKTITINDGFDSFVECEHHREYLDECLVERKEEWVVFFCQKGHPRKEIARFDKEPTISQVWSEFASHH